MTEEELRAALQEARDRADRLYFLLGAADLDIKGWFDRAEQHGKRAVAAEAALREATAEVGRWRWAITEERRLLRLSQEQHRDGLNDESLRSWDAYTKARAVVDSLVKAAASRPVPASPELTGVALMEAVYRRPAPAAPPAQEEGRA